MDISCLVSYMVGLKANHEFLNSILNWGVSKSLCK